jgi:hypothetical protein
MPAPFDSTEFLTSIMTYSNETVLEALRRVQLRQIPWVKRPPVFEFLRALGVLETVRQRTAAAPGYHSPVDIAVLTEIGKIEIERLERSERAPQWQDLRVAGYSRSVEPVPVSAP